MSRANDVSDFVIRKINQIAADHPTTHLAILRRGLGHKPGEQPEVWGEFLSGMPESFFGISGKISEAEWAVYISLTLFALHQQGKSITDNPMHIWKRGFGQALAIAADGDDAQEKRFLSRLQALSTSQSIDSFSYHLRQMISLLRAKDIGFDYGQLAKDIYLMQFPNYAPSVRLRWGEDFYRESYHISVSKEENTDE